MRRCTLLLISLAALAFQRERRKPELVARPEQTGYERQKTRARTESEGSAREALAVLEGPGKAPKEKAPTAPAREESGLRVRLGKLQPVILPRSTPVTEKEAKRIKALIASLAKLDRPDFGLSPTLTGHSFSPVPGHATAGALLLFTDHKIKPSAALKSLVELGPKALPFLLEALDDRTPTRIKVGPRHYFGGMWLANELRGNPVNRVEREVLSKRKGPGNEFPEKGIGSYTVKVGDVCFVAIGQIVGRPYRCVRYQPSACVVINSPTEDAQLRAEVRAIWSSKEPARRLLDSLLTDYATEGVSNGWSEGSTFQTEAALRLLYYFPKETAPFVAARLRSLDVAGVGDSSEKWWRREDRNGLRTVDFITAVKWSKDPLIQAALRDIGKRTTDNDIAEAIKN